MCTLYWSYITSTIILPKCKYPPNTPSQAPKEKKGWINHIIIQIAFINEWKGMGWWYKFPNSTSNCSSGIWKNNGKLVVYEEEKKNSGAFRSFSLSKVAGITSIFVCWSFILCSEFDCATCVGRGFHYTHQYKVCLLDKNGGRKTLHGIHLGS